MLEGESIDKYGIYEIELNTDIFCGFFDLRVIDQYKGTLASEFIWNVLGNEDVKDFLIFARTTKTSPSYNQR